MDQLPQTRLFPQGDPRIGSDSGVDRMAWAADLIRILSEMYEDISQRMNYLIQNTQSGVFAYEDAAVTLTHGAYTQMTFTHESWDLGNEFSSSAFTAAESGRYVIACSIYSNSSKACVLVACIYVNGASAVRGWSGDEAAAMSMNSAQVTTCLNLTKGDIVTIYVYQYNYTDAADIATYASATDNWLSIVKVG